MKKYELIEDQFIELCGVKLYRIRALRDFGSISEGDVGGLIEKEENLSHYNNAWVFDDAKVYENAKVFGDAVVSGDAKVFGNARVYGNAWVSENAKVSENAEVYGNAKVYGNARVFGDAEVSSNISKYCETINTPKYNLTFTDNHLRADCQEHTFDEWRNFTEAQIRAMDGRKALEFYPHMISIMESILKIRDIQS